MGRCSSCRYEERQEYEEPCVSCFNYLCHTPKEEPPRKPQTNNDRINAMTPEQKAEFLATFSVEQIVGEWCTKLCPRRKAGEEECDCPYSVKDSIEGWLKSEAKEEA